MPRAGGGGGGVPRAVPDRLLGRGPVPAGHPARRRRARRWPTWCAARPTCCRCSSWARRWCTGPGAQLRRRGPPRAGAGRAPKSNLPTYREFYERRLVRARRRPARRHHRSVARRVEVPFGPDLVFRATDVRGLDLHVEICEDMWVPVPPSAEAALAGATVLANLSGSPITVARAEDRRLLVRSASARCNGGLRLRRGRAGRVDHRPAAGTARRWSTSAATCSPRASGSRPGRSPRWPTSTSTGCARSGCARAPRRQPAHPRRPGRRVPHGGLRARRRPRATSGWSARSDRFPFVPDDARAARAGLLRGLQHPGLRAGAADAGHRLAEGGDRGQRWPRLHPRADRRGQGHGPPGPAPQRHPRLHDARLRHRRDHALLRHPALARRSGSPSRRSTSPPRRGRCWTTSTTRSPAASRSTT